MSAVIPPDYSSLVLPAEVCCELWPACDCIDEDFALDEPCGLCVSCLEDGEPWTCVMPARAGATSPEMAGEDDDEKEPEDDRSYYIGHVEADWDTYVRFQYGGRI